jgi:hypothetical protein
MHAQGAREAAHNAALVRKLAVAAHKGVPAHGLPKYLYAQDIRNQLLRFLRPSQTPPSFSHKQTINAHRASLAGIFLTGVETARTLSMSG